VLLSGHNHWASRSDRIGNVTEVARACLAKWLLFSVL
jgi:hypothetical protein